MKNIFFVFALMISLFTGCVPSPYYQQSFSVPGNKWNHDFKPAFVLEIADTTIHYNLSFIIRHTNNYGYSNIWLNVLVKKPGDAVFIKTRVEIPLATPQGKWLGVGMGEIYEQRRMVVLDHHSIPLTDELVSVSEESINDLFSKKGRYEIRLEQNMREQNLADILHVGLRIEKSSARNVNTTKPKPVS